MSGEQLDRPISRTPLYGFMVILLDYYRQIGYNLEKFYL